MKANAVIEAPRLRLVPFVTRHLTARYVGWLNSPAIVQYSEQRHRVHTLDSCAKYLRSFAGTPNHFWAIEARDGRLGHIGNLTAYVDPCNDLADLGILIGELAARGKGLALEAWVNACRFLFERRGIRKVTAGMMTGNQPMRNLALRAGMLRDGRRRLHYVLDGKEVDIVYVALFAERWRALTAQHGGNQRIKALLGERR